MNTDQLDQVRQRAEAGWTDYGRPQPDQARRDGLALLLALDRTRLERDRAVARARALEEKAAELADLEQALADHITLAPGEYALIELPAAISTEQIEKIRDVVPDDLANRLLFVDGTVHTLKPTEK